MIDKKVAGRKKGLHFLFAAIVMTSVLFTACNPEQNNLGIGIFPSGDTMRVYTDTITNLNVMLVKSRPRVTSVTSTSDSESRDYLLGSKKDSITGLSSAEIVTQLTNNYTAAFGEEGLIDSVFISFYIDEVEGDTSRETRIMIHELTDSISIYSAYYSNTSMEGKYNASTLVDEYVVLKPSTLYNFLITDQDFIDRLHAAMQTDTVLNRINVIQDVIKGFYIHTDIVDELGGSLAKISMGSTYSGIRFKYLHDSVDVDTATYDDWSIFRMNFHNRSGYACQKFNIFDHDFTGTYVGSILGDSTAHPQIGYVQGMAGVNTRISIPDFDKYFDEGLIAINAAKLVFYVVSDSISGIPEEDYHDQLLMINQLNDTTYQVVYDYLIGTDSHYFGQITQSLEDIAFHDPIYFYNFHVGRHLQSVYAGEDLSLDFVLYPSNALNSAGITKFWTNYSDHAGGMRLELIYTKF